MATAVQLCKITLPSSRKPCYTGPVTNLTLAIDDGLLKDARKLAIDQNTTVNQMVREFLETAVRQSSTRDQARQRLLSTRMTFQPGPLNRDELYAR